MTPHEQAVARLRLYIAHVIDHTQDHVREIEAQRPHITAPELSGALETAVGDVERAGRSLEAALAALGGRLPQEPLRHHHGHGHHSHETS